VRAHATTPVPQEMTLFISRCAHAPAPCPSTLARRQPLAAAALSQTRGFRKCFLNGRGPAGGRLTSEKAWNGPSFLKRCVFQSTQHSML